MAGLLPADAGTVCCHAHPIPAARRRDVLFYVPDGIRPYQDQYVAQVLAFFAGVYRVPADAVMQAVAAAGGWQDAKLFTELKSPARNANVGIVIVFVFAS